MKHTILGVGGVGGLIAAALAHSGEDVELILRPESLAKYPDKLSLESPLGNFEVPVKKATSLRNYADVVWLATKATQMDQALASIPDARNFGVMVPLLNGIDHVEELRQRYDRDKVLPATIAVETERAAPGRIVHRSPFVRLNVSSAGRELKDVTDKLQRFGFTVQFVDDEPTLLWSKLIFLAPIALSTTAASSPIGGVVADPNLRSKLESAIREAAAVATADRAHVDPEAVIKNVASLPPVMRSSMQKDVEAGNTPELDAIAGPILRRAEKYNVPVPVTRELVHRIQQRVGKESLLSA